MTYSGKRFAISSPGKDLVSIANFLRSSDTEEECNCTLKKIKSETDAYPAIIECTVVANTKKVNKGDELVIYRERVVKAADQKCAVTLACMPAVKKAKRA